MTVAFEVVVGMVLASAIGASTVFAVQQVHARWGEASLATASRDSTDPVRAAASLEVARLEGPFELAPDAVDYTLFDGVRDELLLAPLRVGEIKRVHFNTGGSSISLRIDFTNGARAAFKPRQIHMQSNPRKEIAAFRINRLLGLSSVPPAIARRFDADKFLRAFDLRSEKFLPRFHAEAKLTAHKYVDGELSWWIPVIEQATIAGYNIDTTDGIVTWMRYLRPWAPIPSRLRSRLRQISNMIVFDYLIDNSDRWTGGNARSDRHNRVLYFMDNTMSFGRDPKGHDKSQRYFKRSQRFSRRLIQNLRNLTADDFRTAVAYDTGPFEFLLTDEELQAMLTRRRYILEHVDDLVKTHGEDNVLAFR